jgi:cyclophilin family peptidyl-prolyl cis-trans isomerase
MMLTEAMAAAGMFVLVLTGMVQAADTPAADTAADTAPVKVLLKTSMGNVTLELDRAKAPLSVANFVQYAESKHYDGTIFHRVIPGFMIQGGGFTAEMQQRPTQPPIKNEAGNGLKNLTGTVAMARTNVVDSATAQFFINAKDNAFLDHRDESPAGFGYAVFGKVVDGMDVVKKIEGVATATQGPHRDVPATPVVIESVTIVK